VQCAGWHYLNVNGPHDGLQQGQVHSFQVITLHMHGHRQYMGTWGGGGGSGGGDDDDDDNNDDV
jgi:hypothetical protein